MVKQLKNDDLDVTFCHLDITNQQDLDRKKNDIEVARGHFDVLINNAPILYDYFQPTATPSGSPPTGIVFTTLLVLPSITEIELSSAFAMYILFVFGLAEAASGS
jgi:NAD(P)-dependent dehydrogenase (short-subunit alcohol dehydrogenase family)